MEEVERKRELGEMDFQEIVERDKEIQRGERWERIIDSKYNRWKGIPAYLKKKWGESRWRRVARFRLGNSWGRRLGI